MSRIVVGVDVGSSRVKAAGYLPSGRRAMLSAVPTPVLRRRNGTDFPVLDVLDAIGTVVTGLGVPTDDIAGIGFASMGEAGTVLRDGELVGLDFPSWHDLRGAEVVADLNRQFDPSWLTGRTAGHVRTASSLAKLGWLHRAGVPLDGTFLTVVAAATWRLTGRCVQSSSLAVTGGAFDPVRGEHDEDIWSAAGLASVRQPQVEPDVAVPATGQSAGGWLSLRAGTPVVIAGHDHPVGAVGLGAGERDVIDSMGSGEALLTRWRPAVVPSITEVAEMIGTGFSLEAWPGSLDLAVIKEGLRPGFAMQAMAEHIGIGRDELDELTGSELGGEPLPADLVARLETGGDEPAEERRYPGGAGLDLSSWSALIRYYALAGADGEDQLRALTGADGRLVLTGGGLRSKRWVAAKRAARNSAAPVVEAPEQEAVTRGAAALAGVAAGWWAEAAGMPGGLA